MDKETRELIMSLLEEDEVRVPRPPPSRESRPSLPLQTAVPATSQRHLERRSAPDFNSYSPQREYTNTTFSGNQKEMRIGTVPDTLSRESRHTRVRIRRKGPPKRLYFYQSQKSNHFFNKLTFDESYEKPIAISWASNVDGTKTAERAGTDRPIYCGKKPKLKRTNKAGPV